MKKTVQKKKPAAKKSKPSQPSGGEAVAGLRAPARKTSLPAPADLAAEMTAASTASVVKFRDSIEADRQRWFMDLEERSYRLYLADKHLKACRASGVEGVERAAYEAGELNSILNGRLSKP